MKGYELILARRLAWKTEGRRKVSPAVGVAIVGVALSVMVMLVSVAVMLGFKTEVTHRIMQMDNAITITGYSADNSPAPFPAAEVLSVVSLPAEAEVLEQVSVPGIIKTADDFMGFDFQSPCPTGPPADSVVIISKSAAAKLRLSPGDQVPAYFFANDRMRVRMLTVGELYDSGMGDHDDAVAYCAASLPAGLLGLAPGMVHSLGIRGIDPADVEALASEVYSELLTAYYGGQLTAAYGISTILQADGQIFSWLRLLDTNVVVILVLMGLVASFTLISSLFIIILERVRTIGLLKALGADNRRIRTIFMLMAERLMLAGLAIGNALAIGLIVLQYYTHLIPLDAASYYVDFVPVRLTLWSVIAVNVGALALSWLVLMLPAMIVARISPASTMRYE